MHELHESWVGRAARLHPRRIAVDAPDGVLDYAALDAASAVLAAALAARTSAGDEIALRLGNGAAFAVALHACLRSGRVAVPIDARLTESQRREREQGTVLGLDAADVQPWLAAAGAAPLPRERRPLAGSGRDAATPAVRLATSGTTGPGTPVQLTRGALLWNALGSAAALGQPPHERWLSAMPCAHVGGLTVYARSAIGATTAVVRPRFDLTEQLVLLHAGAATITSLVPTMLGRLLDAGLERPPNLRLVLLGGAPITPALLRRADHAGIPVVSTYGLSEAGSQVLTDGHPLFCTQIALRCELPAGDAAGAGDPGELLVRGPTLATGAAGAGGWLATGDRGERATDGGVRIVGRIAETIVSGGENVAPIEVEERLLEQPGIADAAVLGVPDPEWGERIEARVVLAPGAALDAPVIRDALRASLPPFAVPKAITAVPALPRTPTGKLIRRELR